MTDLSEIGTSKGGSTNPARICSRLDRVADSAEISDKDVLTMNSHTRRTKLRDMQPVTTQEFTR